MNFRQIKQLTYAQTGVNRTTRERSRQTIYAGIVRDTSRYQYGTPVRLPFGIVYPSPPPSNTYYDLQIEGVGTKTLLAELTGNYDTIGIDAVAMASNDVIRSGARPVLLSDAIHIASTDKDKLMGLLRGIRWGASSSGCILASGETGNVQELLHEQMAKSSPPFDLMVACLGIAKKSELIVGSVKEGDSIIGLRSSGIHSNGLTLARKVLLKTWGGKFDPWFKPPLLRRAVIEELLEPTTIYVPAIQEVQKSTEIKATIHITGDGFAKFHRLLRWQRRFKQSRAGIGIKFEGLRRMPPIFRLIYETAKDRRSPISLAEMFRTFNMGYGFAAIVAKNQAERAISLFGKHVKAEQIGTVSSSGNISVSTPDSVRAMVL
jgi:phosphoribosylformylglycinamidine cyclo-ligase